MFKYILRVRIGGWWLLAGVWLKWHVSPFQYRNMWWDYRVCGIDPYLVDEAGNKLKNWKSFMVLIKKKVNT